MHEVFPYEQAQYKKMKFSSKKGVKKTVLDEEALQLLIAEVDTELLEGVDNLFSQYVTFLRAVLEPKRAFFGGRFSRQFSHQFSRQFWRFRWPPPAVFFPGGGVWGVSREHGPGVCRRACRVASRACSKKKRVRKVYEGRKKG